MPPSGTYTFNLSIDELLEEAAELANINWQEANGIWARRGKRTMDLLLADWANRGVKLWTLDFVVLPTVVGQATYTLPSQYYEVLEVSIRQSGTDVRLERQDVRKWIEQANKTQQGRPSSYLVERKQNSTILTLWPIPNDLSYSIVYWGIRYSQDSTSLQADPDAPRRFWPALAAGIAVDMARKSTKPRTEKDALLADLKPEYEARLLRAMEEDAERTSFDIKIGC